MIVAQKHFTGNSIPHTLKLFDTGEVLVSIRTGLSDDSRYFIYDKNLNFKYGWGFDSTIDQTSIFG